MLLLKKSVGAVLSVTVLGLLALLSVAANAADYYVDNGRSTSGDGSQGNPWKDVYNINWGTIQSALNNGPVRLFFSSRSTWSSSGNLTIEASGTGPTKMLTVIGDQQFNTTSSGTATWQSETTGRRALLSGTGSGGGTAYIDAGRSNIVFQGFELNKPTWGGIVIGQQNPANNIQFITITNCFVHDVVNSTGISMLFAEAGCHDVTVSHCVVSNSPAEGIYMGHYNWMAPTITNIVVEYNTVVDTGREGEGDIDIKPGVKGAIIRYNKHYRSATGLGGANCGVVVLANDCKIYGNTFYRTAMGPDGDWGYGVYVCADGDGQGNGQSITSCLIYNNLLYSNGKNGIRLLATTATTGADVRGVRIWNNTIWGNSLYGVEAVGHGGRTIEILDFKNNLVGGNTSYDVYLSGTVTLVSANNNLYYRTSGNSWYFNGEKTLSTWRSLGFDLNGKVGDPLFQDTSVANYQLRSGSGAIDAGVASSLFTTDILGRTRAATAWDIGAYESGASGPSGPSAPLNLRVVQTGP